MEIMKGTRMIFLCFIVSLAACQKEPQITVNTPVSMDLPADGSGETITFSATRDWAVSWSESWVHVTPASGSATRGKNVAEVTVSCDANTTYEDRTATVTIKAEEAVQTITIRQLQNDEIILSGDNHYSVPNCGWEFSLSAETNVLYDVVPDVNWIHHVNTKALSKSTIRLRIDKNETSNVREGKVEIKKTNGSLSRVITFKQFGQTTVTAAKTIDLGIVVTRPDKTTYKLYWADRNIGASSPEDFGDYYAWGEIETKEDYSWLTHKFRTSGDSSDNVKFSKYNTSDKYGQIDNKIVLDPEDDVAHIKLGGKWRMPTKEELDALKTQCTWTWTTLNGVNGYEVRSKVNSNSIFLPAAGYRNGTSVIRVGLRGYYWLSSLYTVDPYFAYYLTFYSSGAGRGYGGYRYYGWSVRPVTE